MLALALSVLLAWPGPAGLPGSGAASPEPGRQAAVAPETVPFIEAERSILLELSPLPAPPADPTNAVAADARAARLGQALFYGGRLSVDGSISCSSCHHP